MSNHTDAPKPCPFCGTCLQGEHDEDGSFYTHPKGDCLMSEWEFDGLNSLARWSRRAPVAAEQALIDAAREEMREACHEIAMRHWQDEGTYAAGKKQGALECARTIAAKIGQSIAAQSTPASHGKCWRAACYRCEREAEDARKKASPTFNELSAADVARLEDGGKP